MIARLKSNHSQTPTVVILKVSSKTGMIMYNLPIVSQESCMVLKASHRVWTQELK